MPVLQFGTREAVLNIVYDGPPFAGRATALRHLHTHVKNMPRTAIIAREQAKAKALSLPVPLAAGLIRPQFRTTLMLQALSGLTHRTKLRESILRDADGVIFVADPQWDRMDETMQAFEALKTTLWQTGTSLDAVPYVVQVSKCDLPEIAPPDYLSHLFARHDGFCGLRFSNATSGVGMLDAPNILLKKLLAKDAAVERECPPLQLKNGP